MCGGDFMNKNPDEAFQFLDYVVEGLDVQAKLATQANALGTYKQYSSNSPYSNTYNPGWRNHPNLSWREVTMASFNSKETDFRVIRLMGSKVFNHKQESIPHRKQVAIIENKAMVKYKDRLSYHLGQIGDSFVERALLDLGASLKVTTITLSLAHRSIKVPGGVVEDVLVQVEKFYYQWTLWC
ncbi:hypothetical protein AAG906_011611 [Vitis piasezkii]